MLTTLLIVVVLVPLGTVFAAKETDLVERVGGLGAIGGGIQVRALRRRGGKPGKGR